MYRIYCNAVCIHLVQKSQWEKWAAEYPNHDAQLEMTWEDSIDWPELFEKWFEQEEWADILVLFNEGEDMLTQFQISCMVIRAAGGVVVNSSDDRLMIFRRGHWDLPKGTIEKTESPIDAALREVAEETGMSGLEIIRPVMLYDNNQPCTYHLYPFEDNWVLKPTYWFLMKGNDAATLTPQTEEDIEKVEWVAKEDVNGYLGQAYANIRDVLWSI